MPRPQTLLFALKLVAIAEDAKNLLTPEEILEAFYNITGTMKEQIDQQKVTEALAARLASRANAVN